MWEKSLNDEIRPKLNECIQFCFRWKSTIQKLCNRWSRDPRRPWTQPYKDPYLEELIRRLHEILELRS